MYKVKSDQNTEEKIPMEGDSLLDKKKDKLNRHSTLATTLLNNKKQFDPDRILISNFDKSVDHKHKPAMYHKNASLQDDKAPSGKKNTVEHKIKEVSSM